MGQVKNAARRVSRPRAVGAALSLAVLFCGFDLRPAEADCHLELIAELPVTMHGMRALIATKINGVDESFIADSGAFFSMISAAKAKELNLSLEPMRRGLMGVAGEADASLTYVKSFTILQTTLSNVPFVVASGADNGYAGLLGQNFFAIKDVDYDFPHGRIRLLKPVDCKYSSAMAYWAGARPYNSMSIEPMDDNNRHTTGVVLVNGKRLRATFDTGATSTLLSRAAAARAGVKLDDPSVRAEGVSSGVGASTMKSWTAEFASVTVGDEEIRHTRLRIVDRLASGVDMLIGADFFISHRIYVANTQRKLYFTYEGGPVFNADAVALQRDVVAGPEHKLDPIVDSEAAPSTAAQFARRGAVRFSARSPQDALKDFDQAVTLAPENALYHLERARVHMALSDGGAPADLDAAITLDPKLPEARLLRAEIELGRHVRQKARVDADAVAEGVAKESDFRLQLGRIYAQLGDLKAAVAQYGFWLDSHPDDAMAGQALNGRCRAKGLSGEDLDAALRDCNRAVRFLPGSAEVFDSRGLVQLRRGKYADAIADYDNALRIEPSKAWSLYGRGLAKLKSGRQQEGEADVKAALSQSAGIAETAKRYGVAP